MTGPTEPRWVTAFLDVPAPAYDDTVAFWAAVTGTTRSPDRGDHAEFASLVPGDGDDHLRTQRLTGGGPRIHLDLHVAHPRAAADHAVRLGATEVADRGYVTLTSPGGLPVCFVTHPAARLAPSRTWPGGHRSEVDQVCLDLPPSTYDEESAFWRALTGWEVDDRPAAEFVRLVRPTGQPLHLLLQRLEDDGDGRTRAHLDLAADDRSAEVARHRGLGAALEGDGRGWTVLRDPAGLRYCITDRDPR